MTILPSVRATLAERFLFNFRVPQEALSRFLPPVPWIAPQIINGHGVVSFCLLDLRNITVAPFPTVAGMTSISCAPRYAILDLSKDPPAAAVYVTERQTNSAFGAWFTTLGFSAPHPYVKVALDKVGGSATRLSVDEPGKGSLFAAVVKPIAEVRSDLFSSCADFAAFIAQGVMSYGLSRHENRLTKMDLHKEDADYDPLRVTSICGPLIEQWEAVGGVLDSAFRTSGGRYEWTYYGLTEEE